MPGGGCCVWDFTASASENELDDVKTTLRTKTKKWAFQLETGKSGYLHYQGRLSLKSKISTEALVAKYLETTWKITRTSTENSTNDFYATKEDTRTDGPWTNKDRNIYVPRQLQGKLQNLLPWQQTIYDQRDHFNDRIVNCVHDWKGNTGKSTLASLFDCHEMGIDLDSGNDGQALIQDLCDQCTAMDTHAPGVVFVDLERSFDQTKLYGMFTAIERIKKGKLSDRRYTYTKWWIDSPQIWVFCNTLPKQSYLSGDRWRFFTINDNKELQRLTETEVKDRRQSEQNERE